MCHSTRLLVPHTKINFVANKKLFASLMCETSKDDKLPETPRLLAGGDWIFDRHRNAASISLFKTCGGQVYGLSVAHVLLNQQVGEPLWVLKRGLSQTQGLPSADCFEYVGYVVDIDRALDAIVFLVNSERLLSVVVTSYIHGIGSVGRAADKVLPGTRVLGFSASHQRAVRFTVGPIYSPSWGVYPWKYFHFDRDHSTLSNNGDCGMLTVVSGVLVSMHTEVPLPPPSRDPEASVLRGHGTPMAFIADRFPYLSLIGRKSASSWEPPRVVYLDNLCADFSYLFRTDRKSVV